MLLASGAAAGMAATFGTPLAAVVLAIELLLFEFSARAFVPLVVAHQRRRGRARRAVRLGSAVLGARPRLRRARPAPVVRGCSASACGLLATVIASGLFAVEHGYRRLPVAPSWHPVIGALVWAPIALLVPRVLGVGYDVIDDALAGRLAVGDARRPGRRQAGRLVDRAAPRARPAARSRRSC